MQKEYLKEILESDEVGKVHLLTSSPKANGFYQAGRVKKFIPGIYRANEERLLKRVKNDTVQIYEYENSDWTFHAKGAWIYENG